MRGVLVAVFLAGAAASATAQQATRRSDPPLILAGATIIDVTGKPPRSKVDIVIQGERIVDIVEAGRPRPTNAQVVDVSGTFMIPGLWDMHVHLHAYATPLLVAKGVTTVRDMGGDLVAIDWMRRAIESGRTIGPAIFRVGPFVDGGKPTLPNRLLVSTKEEGADAARYLATLHVDAIKVHSGVPRDAYFGLVAEAKRLGLSVVGHAPVTVMAAEASNAGQRTIEHMSSVAGGRLNALLARGLSGQQAMDTVEREAPALYGTFVRNGTWIDPTFVAENVSANRGEIAATADPRRDAVPASVRQSWERTWPLDDESPAAVTRKRNYLQRQLRWAAAMHAAGVRFLAGTDLGVRDIFPGASLHEELAWLVRAGLSPLEALQAATINAARVVGQDGTRGSVDVGKVADLVVLDANPLEAIDNTRRIRYVVLRGRLLDRPRLDALTTEAEKAASAR
jgi:imidazolonepropionase-like amidohydrolase